MPFATPPHPPSSAGEVPAADCGTLLGARGSPAAVAWRPAPPRLSAGKFLKKVFRRSNFLFPYGS